MSSDLDCCLHKSTWEMSEFLASLKSLWKMNQRLHFLSSWKHGNGSMPFELLPATEDKHTGKEQQRGKQTDSSKTLLCRGKDSYVCRKVCVGRAGSHM